MPQFGSFVQPPSVLLTFVIHERAHKRPEGQTSTKQISRRYFVPACSCVERANEKRSRTFGTNITKMQVLVPVVF